MIVDSHCHLDRLDKSPDELGDIVASAKAAGVEHMLCVCVSVKEFQSMMNCIEPFADVSASCGVHPLHQEDACSYDELKASADNDKVVAIGETGLDYYYSVETKPVQQTSFVDHVRVANELNKPLIIHTRDAREDTISLLKENLSGDTNGVLHCFTETWEMAKAALDLGFYISISGIVTFNNAAELRDVVRKIPIERLLVETDSPWLAPKPYRGKPNQPAYVREVAEFVADLKGVTFPELAETTTKNFYDLFKLVKAPA